MCSERHGPGPGRRGQLGASIVELMVGLVISLLVGLAATTTAITFMAQQRQGVGVGGIAVNSGTVMASLRDDVAAAGLGFFGDSAYLCQRLNLSVGGTAAIDGAVFSPLQVTRQGDTDVLDVMYASRVESGAAVRVTSASAGTDVLLASFLPVQDGQAVLLAPGPATAAPPPCLVRTVTAQVAATPEAPQRLDFAAAGAHNAVPFTLPSVFDDEARVTQLGELQWSRYRRVGDQLILERPLTGASAIVARDVVSFRVQYGVAAAAPGSTALESWVDPAGAFASLSAANLARVRALRIGLIVRSPLRQKPDAAGHCDATEEKPALFGGAAENLDNADWNCWRYRTTTVLVPLRNVVLGLR